MHTDTINEASAYIEKEPAICPAGSRLCPQLAAVMDRRIDEHMQKLFMEKALEQFDVVLEMEPDNPDALSPHLSFITSSYHKNNSTV